MANFDVSGYDQTKIEEFLYFFRCQNCILDSSNINCPFKSESKLELFESIRALCQTIEIIKSSSDNELYKNIDFCGQNKMLDMNIFAKLCFKEPNLTRLLMFFYFSSINVIEKAYLRETNNLDSMENVSPIFWNSI